MLSEVYGKKFEKVGDYEVLKATSGNETLEKIKKYKPNLVLLDLVLPEMDGFEILRKVRKDEKLDGVKIVPFSNLSQEENRAKAEEMGATGFIAKSEHTPAQIVEKVEELLKEDVQGGESDNQQEKDEVTKKTPPDFQRHSGAGNILMIEDESVFSEVFGLKLENKGFEVEFTETAKDGIFQAGSNKYDLIITDIMMPDRKGSEVVNEIRHTKKNQKTPIYILADETDDKEELEKAQSLGAGKVLDKNKITPEDLVQECRKAIKK
jgi:CheY-like chemotaxis protein